MWEETPANGAREIACGAGNTGKLARFCLTSGAWSRVYGSCCNAWGGVSRSFHPVSRRDCGGRFVPAHGGGTGGGGGVSCVPDGLARASLRRRRPVGGAREHVSWERGETAS